MTLMPATASSGSHGWGGYKVHFTETCDAPERNPARAGTSGRARHRRARGGVTGRT